MSSTTTNEIKNIICFVAGHSGGHIIPCLTQATKELQINPQSKIIFFTTDKEFDRKIINNFTENVYYLPIRNVPSKFYLFIPFFWYFFISFLYSFKILFFNKPKKIISTGGLISIPVILAGKLLQIPCEIYELNVEPGKATNFLSPFVSQINICFEETKNYFPKKFNIVKYPIRFNNEDKISREEALKKIGFEINKKTIFIIGGSQGSNFLNKLIKEWIENNPNLCSKSQIIHQIGNDNTEWKNFYSLKKINSIIFDYNPEIQNFYCASDLIISRAGAGTLAEILFFEKKCIVIPLETSTTLHQVKNAKILEKKYSNLLTMMKQNEIEKDKILFFENVNLQLQN